MAACAIPAVAVPTFGSMRTPGMMTAGATLIVVVWLDVLLVQALAYGRHALTRGGLDFPGAGPEHLSDLVYFSAAVQTTFGTTDVTVTDNSVRRLVTMHALLAFAYNTFVVAIMVSLVVAG